MEQTLTVQPESSDIGEVPLTPITLMRGLEMKKLVESLRNTISDLEGRIRMLEMRISQGEYSKVYPPMDNPYNGIQITDNTGSTGNIQHQSSSSIYGMSYGGENGKEE